MRILLAKIQYINFEMEPLDDYLDSVERYMFCQFKYVL